MSIGDTLISSPSSSSDSSDSESSEAVVSSGGEMVASDRVVVGKDESDRRSAGVMILAGSIVYIHLSSRVSQQTTRAET